MTEKLGKVPTFFIQARNEIGGGFVTVPAFKNSNTCRTNETSNTLHMDKENTIQSVDMFLQLYHRKNQ